MSDDRQADAYDIVFKLDTERRQEINDIKTRMESFLGTQTEFRHTLEIVARNQDQLKERFEIGTAKTLRELKDSFDAFRTEWGEKKSEDKHRDKTIEATALLAEKAMERSTSIIMGFAYSIFGSIALALIIWAVSKIIGPG